MSVIAWDGKIIACDRQGTNGDTILRTKKMFKLRTGHVCAFTGSIAEGTVMVDWFKGGADPSKFPQFQNDQQRWTRLIVVYRGKLTFYEMVPKVQRIYEKFFSWGSGSDIAIGAMAAGANAIEAVRIASRYNVSCGFGVDYHRF